MREGENEKYLDIMQNKTNEELIDVGVPPVQQALEALASTCSIVLP